jgi:hypothetical protein
MGHLAPMRSTLLDAALNQRLHTVTDATGDGRRVRNDAETSCRSKQEALITRFSTWVWRTTRAERLATTTACSPRRCSHHDGSHLTLPGLAGLHAPITSAAVAASSPTAAPCWPTRSARARPPPWSWLPWSCDGSAPRRSRGGGPEPHARAVLREWLQIYRPPGSSSPTGRLSKDRRKEFVARAATGDWDGSCSPSPGSLPLGADLMREYLAGRSRPPALRSPGLATAKGLSVKKLERRIAQMEENYKRLLAEHTKDDGVRFEETGIDFLFCDEAHAYKNRRVDSSIDGAANTGSQRAQDLDSKLWALRRARAGVAVFATATPVANSMAELWVMQTYLQPDQLEAVGCDPSTRGPPPSVAPTPPSSWHRTGRRIGCRPASPGSRTSPSCSPSTGRSPTYAPSTTSTSPPAIAGGQAETVVVDPSDNLVDYVLDLAARAERIRNRAVDPAEDNMLKVTGDGRRRARPPPRRPGRTDRTGQARRRRPTSPRSTTPPDHRYADDHGQLTLRPVRSSSCSATCPPQRVTAGTRTN